jgi:hypothetical protein
VRLVLRGGAASLARLFRSRTASPRARKRPPDTGVRFEAERASDPEPGLLTRLLLTGQEAGAASFRMRSARRGKEHERRYAEVFCDWSRQEKGLPGRGSRICSTLASSHS